MTIPEAVVEAAADYLPHARDCESRPERDCQCRHLRLDIMRAALDATVPHMLAEAWEAGHKGGKSDAFAADKGFTGYHANPYRATS